MRRFLILALLLTAGAAAALILRSPAPEPVTLSNATAEIAGPDQLRVYLTIQNGATPNTLRAVSSPEAAEARIIGATDVVIPAGAAPGFASDGAFVVLSGVTGPLDEGRLVPIRLDFAPSGSATTRARITAPSDPHAAHRAGATLPETLPETPPETVPSVALEARAEAGGWTLSLRTENFTFAPEAETPQHVPGEGHGHLYLNGLKLQRVYSPDIRIGAVPPGRHELGISLNDNLHRPYVSQTGPVAASVWIEAR